MLVDFKTLPDHARIWIYPSNRPFSEVEQQTLKGSLSNFLSHWTSHNQSLEASFDLPYNRFIVIFYEF